jgi:hypothetical protein
MPTRHAVFETNSSSTHSITMGPASEGLIDTGWYINENGHIRIPLMEFGWEDEDYSDFESKLAYASLYVRDWARAGSYGERDDEKDAEKKALYWSILLNVVQARTKCTDLVWESSYSKWAEGYIDHQSVESNDLDYLFEDPARLDDFLFSTESVLHTQNDNSGRGTAEW